MTETKREGEEVVQQTGIPNEVYLYPNGGEQISNENPELKGQGFPIDLKRAVKEGYLEAKPSPDGQRTIYTVIPRNGLFFPVEGGLYPLKAFPEPNAVFAANLVKAHIIETIKVISKWYLIPFLALINKQNALDAFNRISFKAICVFLMRDKALTDFVREFKGFLFNFLRGMGFTEESSKTFALVFSHVIELDNVYRLRLADAFSETSKEALIKSPIKEIKRLLKIMKSREVRPGGKGDAIHRKFDRSAFLLMCILLIPRVRRVFKEAISKTEFRNLQLDDSDKYWICYRNDYLWMGMTDDERKEYALKRGWPEPKPTLGL